MWWTGVGQEVKSMTLAVEVNLELGRRWIPSRFHEDMSLAGGGVHLESMWTGVGQEVESMTLASWDA